MVASRQMTTNSDMELHPDLPDRDDDAAAFARLAGIVSVLRSPEGCPWDREQTPRSLTGGLIEEVYECVEAITDGSLEDIREELGDLFLLATMISYMHEEEKAFSVADVLHEISEKLIRRHPHVFGDVALDNSRDVIVSWNKIKVDVEGKRPKDSVLDGIPRSLPPLARAAKIQGRAAKIGFDWPTSLPVYDKIHEEVAELREAAESDNREAAESRNHDSTDRQDRIEAELGDLLFAVVNLARHLDVDPGAALHRTNERFSRRFRHVEKRQKTDREGGMSEADSRQIDSLEKLWIEAKEREGTRTGDV